MCWWKIREGEGEGCSRIEKCNWCNVTHISLYYTDQNVFISVLVYVLVCNFLCMQLSVYMPLNVHKCCVHMCVDRYSTVLSAIRLAYIFSTYSPWHVCTEVWETRIRPVKCSLCSDTFYKCNINVPLVSVLYATTSTINHSSAFPISGIIFIHTS